MQRIRSCTLALSLAAAALLFPAVAHASASGVVVSQLYGGGGNAGATFTHDYVELFNAGATAVDVSGWSLQYATAAGTTWQTTALSGTIAPGGYYLVQLASTAAVGAPLPPPDATGLVNLSATSGKVALVRDATAVTCGAAAGSCSAEPFVEDLVGYGAASDFEGSGSAPALTSTTAGIRGNGGCADTGDNAADFTAGTPAPRNSASAADSCVSEPPPPDPGGGSASASVALDVPPVLTVSLDRPALSFGPVAAGETPAPLAENVTVASNVANGYSLQVDRTSFTPADLPLAISATAPPGGTLAPGLAGGGLVAIPVTPSPSLAVGTTAGVSAATGDVWATSIGFTSPLPLVAAGRYTATVTFTVIGR